MKISDILGMSLGSLFKRKVRTILTIMGVVIGTTSIVVMLSLGLGLKAALMAEFESYGSLKSVDVEADGMYDSSSSDKKKNPEDYLLSDERIQEFLALDHVVSVDPELRVSVLIKCGVYECSFQVTGVTRDVLESKRENLGQGTIPAEGDDLSFVYGNSVIQYFYNAKNGYNPYWDRGELPDIDLMNDQIFVIFDQGSYNPTSDEGGSDEVAPTPKKYIVKTAGLIAGGPEDWNEDSYGIYCDIEALKEVLAREFRGRVIPGQPTRKNGKPYRELFYSTVHVNVDEMDNVNGVQTIINEMGFRSYSNAEWIESDMQVMNIIQAVLGGIGGISLFVAAIGITNTMMMSIYERTKEIGIMKVIGCRIRDIQLLFLIEAGYIGFIGGMIGILLSYLISYILNKGLSLGEMMFNVDSNISVIPPWLAIISVAFAAVIAMLAGFLPSIRAMKLSPLAAIRAE